MTNANPVTQEVRTPSNFLHDIIAEHSKITPAEAVEYVKAMKKEKRYLRDVY